MKIILLQDISAVGRKNEVKEVRDGYARNFLLPRRFALPASDLALKDLETHKARQEKQKSDEDTRYRATAEALKKTSLRFKVKLGEKGKAFGSVSASKIRDALQKEGIAADKDWIVLDEPIKTTGEHAIEIKFPHGIVGNMKVIVEAE